VLTSDAILFIFFSPRELSKFLTVINVFNVSSNLITQAEAEKKAKLALFFSCRKHLVEKSQCNKQKKLIPALDYLNGIWGDKRSSFWQH